jgi:hypothetical protein
MQIEGGEGGEEALLVVDDEDEDAVGGVEGELEGGGGVDGGVERLQKGAVVLEGGG